MIRLPKLGWRWDRHGGADKLVLGPPERTAYLDGGRTTPGDLMAPAAMDPRPGYLDLGGRYARTLKAVGFPRDVENGWLDPLYSFPADLRVAQYIFPLPSGPVISELNAEIVKLETRINDAHRRRKPPDAYDLIALEDAVALRDALARNQIKLCVWHLYVTLFAGSLEELDDLTDRVRQELDGIMLATRTCYFQQEEGFKTTLPLGQLLVPSGRNMDTLSLATTMPFSTSELVHQSGEFWGINLANRSVVILDRGLLPAGHMVVIGATGTGKSFAIKNVMTQSHWWGRPVLVVDPSKSEWRRWVERLGGQYVHLSLSSAHRVNVCALVPPQDLSRLEEDELRPVSLKVGFLINFLEVLLNNPGAHFSPAERAVLDRVLRQVYAERGFTDDWASVYDTRFERGFGRLKEMPVLGDVYDALRADPEGGDLALRLEPYVHGSLALFNGQTNVDLSSDVIGFNIYGLLKGQPHLAEAVYYALSDFALAWLWSDRRPKEIVLDEAHHMFRRLNTAQFVSRLYREARKAGGRVTLMSQCLTDFLGREGGEDTPLKEEARVCLANAYTKFVLTQTNPAEARYAGRVFNLSQAEVRLVTPPADQAGESLRLRRGVGVLIAGGQRVAVRVQVPPSLHRLITTDPEELRIIEAEEAEDAEAGRPA